MKNTIEIKKLAWERLEEASILFNNGKNDGAFYLLGYSVELMLKAKICERLDIPNLFDDKSVSIEGVSDIRKVVKTHNLKTLLILSGLKKSMEDQMKGDKNFSIISSLLINQWSEQSRYEMLGNRDSLDLNKIIEFLKDKNGFLEWISQN